MVIQHNMAAANTNRQLGITTGNIAKSTEKLSSGYKINRAGDNAKRPYSRRCTIRGLNSFYKCLDDLLNPTAEGALMRHSPFFRE